MKFLCALLILCAAELAAQPQTMVAPDCPSAGIVSVSGSPGAPFDNRPIFSSNPGTTCTTWILTYTALTGTPTISISVQQAPNNNGVPGSWTTISGATSTTTPSGSILIKNSAGYWPFIRVFVTTISAGNISWVLNGWRDNAGSISGGGGGGGSGCPGTSGSPCDVQGVTAPGSAATENPVFFGGQDASQNKVGITLGTTSGTVALTTSGLTQLIALSSGKQIRLTHISVSFASPTDFQLEYGTGSNCGSGTTALTGNYKSILTVALDFDLDPLLVPASQALCANLGSSVTGGGLVKYAQF